MPGIVLRGFIYKAFNPPWGRYCYNHLTDVQLEAQRRVSNLPCKWWHWDSNPGSLASEAETIFHPFCFCGYACLLFPKSLFFSLFLNDRSYWNTDYDSVGLGWSPIFCICDKLPDDADDAQNMIHASDEEFASKCICLQNPSMTNYSLLSLSPRIRLRWLSKTNG